MMMMTATGMPNNGEETGLLTPPTVNLAHNSYKIALFYCYTNIDKVKEHVHFQHELCTNTGLLGRIRVSSEGLNGVLSGLEAHLKAYQLDTQRALGIEEIDVKYCSLRTDLAVEVQLFTTLSVRETKEVVTLFESTPADTRQGGDEISKQSYRRRRRNRVKCEQRKEDPASSANDMLLNGFSPAPHLNPKDWNQSLLSHREDAILIDARNAYESRVGHFKVEGIPTLLTNTRKYTSLTDVLLQSKEHLAGKSVYMFCTGGVRCERASVYLQALATSDEWKGLEPPKAIYQLDGGIQRYLETFGSTGTEQEECLYLGKNFVFDQRRTDPCTGKGLVGSCMLCRKLWDDYDNGHAPADNMEGRCCRCRILLLVCNDCRPSVRSWGEPTQEGKPNLYCGGEDCIKEGNCVSQAELLLCK
jgi:predicted sulfurtransferase